MAENAQWLLAIVAAAACWPAMTLEWALRHLSWSRLEPRIRGDKQRRRLERLLQHERSLGSACVVVGVIAAAALAAATFSLAANYAGGQVKWLSGGFFLAGTASLAATALLAVVLPAFVGMRWGERIVITLAPLLTTLALRSTRLGRNLFPRRLGRNRTSAASASGAASPEDWEARALVRTVARLRRVTVAEVMTQRTDVVGIESGAGIEEAAEVARTSGHTRLPAWRETPDDIVGVLYVKDLLKRMRREGWDGSTVAELMRAPYFVPETKTAMEMLREFRQGRAHVAIVLDEYGGTSGLVTIEDIIEEVFGELREGAEEGARPPLLRLNARAVEVDGRLRLAELNEELNVDLQRTGDFETVAGYVTYRLGRIPKAREDFTFEGLRFTVMAADARRVLRMRVESLGEE